MRTPILLGLACLVAASAFATDSFLHRLWVSFVFGVMIAIACLIFLLGRLSMARSEEPALSADSNDETEPLAAYIDQAPLPLLSFRAGRGLAAVNRAARSLFDSDDLIVDPPLPLLDAIAQSRSGVSGSMTLFGKAYAIGVSEIATARDTIKLVSLMDIQAEIRMAEATALRDLLRVLSHEIMNSLTPVSNLAGIARDYLAEEKSPASQAANEALDLLEQRASGLTSFVEAYRAMAKLPEPVLQPVDLGRLLRDIARVFEQSIKAKSISLELDMASQIPQLELDETLLTQAILNVLTNAAEAVSAIPEHRKIRLSVVSDGREIRILVADNGCGVPEALNDQIFHAFVTTKPSGTGTGLNLARQIALAQGGDLVFLGRSENWSAVFAFILRS
jgi:signal transduction histidine kinase